MLFSKEYDITPIVNFAKGKGFADSSELGKALVGTIGKPDSVVLAVATKVLDGAKGKTEILKEIKSTLAGAQGRKDERTANRLGW